MVCTRPAKRLDTPRGMPPEPRFSKGNLHSRSCTPGTKASRNHLLAWRDVDSRAGSEHRQHSRASRQATIRDQSMAVESTKDLQVCSQGRPSLFCIFLASSLGVKRAKALYSVVHNQPFNLLFFVSFSLVKLPKGLYLEFSGPKGAGQYN